LKLEYKITDDEVRTRIRDVRLAYGRDPHCIACNADTHMLLNQLYNKATSYTVAGVYTGDTLYGIPVIVNPRIRQDDLLFLVDIDTLRESTELEELGLMPEELR